MLCGLGLLLLGLSWRQRRALGLPPGRIVSIDDQALDRPDGPLLDRALGLTGAPDYLVSHRGMVIPVEVKSGRTPSEPYESHVMQLAAYCALVESVYGVRPAHGVLCYPEWSFAIDYTRGLERRLKAVVAAIRAVGEVAPRRSHRSPERCRACGYQRVCDQPLEWPAGRKDARI